MKKIAIVCAMCALVLGSCANKQKEEEERQRQALAVATTQQLQEAVTDRDQLLDLVNEISSGMGQIKQLENILTVNGANETKSQREQIRQDIAAIQQTLQERREKLEQLEKKLKNSNFNNSKMNATIASLRSQIDSQNQEITTLQANLDQAKTRIGQLDATVDSLNTTVTKVTTAMDSTATRNSELTNELNLCYYAIGSKGELKENKIIETGFLRKTKIMEGDFDRGFFTVGDKRTLTTLDLNSDKAKVLTNQPADSYTISDVNGHKVLRITNPAAFWNLSNYLVIQID
ncbi:MAG: hypothetical protein K2F63_03850 [Muribaculaceae bacterium]|nr:hypothetical protein [Muribaculaceae bacterium]MDE6134852.1 hypothetical protein [Muribaculaceae bacterium]